MEGIEIMLIGGYKRKKEQLADPLSASATEKVLLFLLSCMCVVRACVRACVSSPICWHAFDVFQDSCNYTRCFMHKWQTWRTNAAHAAQPHLLLTCFTSC